MEDPILEMQTQEEPKVETPKASDRNLEMLQEYVIKLHGPGAVVEMKSYKDNNYTMFIVSNLAANPCQHHELTLTSLPKRVAITHVDTDEVQIQVMNTYLNNGSFANALRDLITGVYNLETNKLPQTPRLDPIWMQQLGPRKPVQSEPKDVPYRTR